MLIGQYQHNIDPKGRLIMPAKLREELGDRFIITRGLDSCLFVYSLDEWSGLEARIRTLPLARGRGLQLFFFANAAEVEPDGQGRVLIPANLREYAGLTKEAVIIGSLGRVEIWRRELWEQMCSELTAESITSAMTELGF